MIKTRQDLARFLAADKQALGITKSHPCLFDDYVWRFQRLYRKTEYFYNNRNKNILFRIWAKVLKFHYDHVCRKRCCEIPLNCIDEGLCIWHGYNIIINEKAKIGKNFGISANTNVGHAHGQVPVIGDNVTLTFGAKVIGGIHICDNVTVGAGALVLKSIDEQYVTVGGVPAKILSRKNPTERLIRG